MHTAKEVNAGTQLVTESLERLLQRQRFDLHAALRLSVQLIRALQAVHAQHTIYSALRPDNILLGEAGAHLVLKEPADTALQSSETKVSSEHLAYCSPEQTGRMNRAVDYRTDFYSLGVILYRLFTGELPFVADDPLEWIHSHIACMPRLPSEVHAGIPQAISDILMKLLAKVAEERYQSARGILFDLEHCLTQYESIGRIDSFRLATQDISDRFQIAQKLYGRETELENLLTTFFAMASSGQPVLVMLSGYSGIGKSSLANELHKPIVQAHGYFIAGKFDQHQRDIPYATLIEAFQALVRQILGEKEEYVAQWRKRLLAALGNNGQLMIDLLPDLEMIIGRQPPVPELPSLESQNRFRIVFRQFIGVFTQKEHPLALFLDDLQWADFASLKLLKELITHPEMRFLFVIGAFRDNEVTPFHPLTLMLEEARKADANIIDIELGPLSLAHLTAFVADTLHCATDKVAPLAKLVNEKTAGNPFFTIQFLSALYDEKLIEFNAKTGSWCWDIKKIQARNFTDNIVELMIGKLKKLPEKTLEILKKLACLGNNAPTPILALVTGQNEQQIHIDLWNAVRAGLVLRLEAGYKFLHDRVQEATYSLIPEGEREHEHLRIGMLLVAHYPAEGMEERIFDVVNHLNSSLGLIKTAAQKKLLCKLNFEAGKKAKSAVAYGSARNYLNLATDMLPDNAWQSDYDNTFTLYFERSECEYLVGNYECANGLFNLILEKAQNNPDRARVYSLRVKQYQVAGHYDDALDAVLEGLQLFGISFPSDENEGKELFAREYRNIEESLQNCAISDLANAPIVTDPDVKAVLHLLGEAMPSAYRARPKLYFLFAMRAVSLCLRHGNTEDSCFAYSYYAMLQISAFGDIARGFAFSEMSLQLNEKLNDRTRRGALLFLHATYLNFWCRPFSSCLELLEQAFTACLEVGNLSYAGYAINHMIWDEIEKSRDLDEVFRISRKSLAFHQQTQNHIFYQEARFVEQYAAVLKGESKSEISFDGGDFNEENFLAMITQHGYNSGLGVYIIARISAIFYFGHYDEVLKLSDDAPDAVATTNVFAMGPTHDFYYALSACALYENFSAERQKQIDQVLAKTLQKLKEWSESCAENYLDRYALVLAEKARLEKRFVDAERWYEQAILAARKYGQNRYEALGYELAARFYRARGFEQIADTYLRSACAAYQRWGASGKVKQLRAQHPQLIDQRVNEHESDQKQFDLLAVTRALQAISREIVFDKLLDKLMRIMIQNAGAQQAYLLLVRKEMMHLVAEAEVRKQDIHVTVAEDQEFSDARLPLSMLNYVRRSREKVLLVDANLPNPFSADVYFTHRHPKSVLCLPIILQTDLIGLLYLDNYLATHAFTSDRLSALELLAGQAAISIENAALYNELKQENIERKQAEEALQRAHDELELRVQERTIRLSQANVALQNEINERKQAEQALRLRNRAVESSVNAIVIIDCHRPEYPIEYVNPAFERITGYSPSDVIGHSICFLLGDDLDQPEFSKIQSSLRWREEGRATIRNYRKDGTLFWNEMHVAPVRDEVGHATHFVCILNDITESKNYQEQLKRQAGHDTLTGLPNRSILMDRLKQAITQAQREHYSVAVAFFDLDRFKFVNDTMGHKVGDELLIQISNRLISCVRKSDTVVRIGGDEFVLILPDQSRGERGREEAGPNHPAHDENHAGSPQASIIDVLNRVVRMVAQPVNISNRDLNVTCSVGVSIFPQDGSDAETLLKNADAAMYRAKEEGRNNFQFYTDEINARVLEQLSLESMLEDALKHEEFSLHYQPKLDLHSGRISGVEALLRWNNPERGTVPPVTFIPILERTGMINEVGKWVICKALEDHANCAKAGIRMPPIALNISQIQLEQKNFVDMLTEILESSESFGGNLELEVTESMVMKNPEINIPKLRTIREMGVGIAIDDFGTGYSSLSHLAKLPVNVLKVDRTFIAELTTNASDFNIVHSMISLAHSMGLKVIAEGVEVDEQQKMLYELGCDEIQGYLLSKPLPLPQYLEWQRRFVASAAPDASSADENRA